MRRYVLFGWFLGLAACSAAPSPAPLAALPASSPPVSQLPRAGEPSTICPAGMVHVPAGGLMMGSSEYVAERPAELDGFCIGRTEVTVAEYQACVLAGACQAATTTHYFDDPDSEDERRRLAYDRQFCNAGRPDRANHPINCVDAHMADAYCAWAGRRLPTEVEWEYAARGRDGRRYPWGNEPPGPRLLNVCGPECTSHLRKMGGMGSHEFDFDDGWPETAPVGSFPAGASPFGVLDMAGNVEEWTASPSCEYAGDTPTNGGSCELEWRITRGGHWYWGHELKILAYWRTSSSQVFRLPTIGFRCAK